MWCFRVLCGEAGVEIQGIVSRERVVEFFLIIYSACSITVSNTTCTFDILYSYLSSNVSYIYYINICQLNCGLLFFFSIVCEEIDCP